MSELQSECGDESVVVTMTEMKRYVLSTWNLNETLDLLTPPLFPQPSYRARDPWLTFALFSLAKATPSLDTAREAVLVVVRRNEHADQVTLNDIEDARDDVVRHMEPEVFGRYQTNAPVLGCDEVRWNVGKGEYEGIYESMPQKRNRERSERGSRPMSRRESRDVRWRSHLGRPMGRSTRPNRQRSRSPARPSRRETRTSSIREPIIPPPQPSSQRGRSADQPAFRGSATHHVNEYAIDLPTLVADPPGATFNEKLGLRDEAVQLFGAQEEYYEAVRRKMLVQYMARAQMYEKRVIEIRKRVAGEERTRYNRDDE